MDVNFQDDVFEPSVASTQRSVGQAQGAPGKHMKRENILLIIVELLMRTWYIFV